MPGERTPVPLGRPTPPPAPRSRTGGRGQKRG
ncbi:hypothetical protein Nmel_013678 [Mimus melanotis]